MWFLIVLFIIIVGGCWQIAKAIGEQLFPTMKDSEENSKVIINTYITEQHLHITAEDFQKIIDSKKANT